MATLEKTSEGSINIQVKFDGKVKDIYVKLVAPK